MAGTYKGFALTQIAGDVSSPIEGEVWYNTTSNRFKMRDNNSSEIIPTSNEAQFDAVVSATDYGSVGAAIADGHRRIRVKTGPTEPSNITVAGGSYYIWIDAGQTWDLDTNKIIVTVATNFYLRGQGNISNQSGTTVPIFDTSAAPSSIIDCDGITIDMGGTASGTFFADTSTQRFNNCILQCANALTNVNFRNFNSDSYITNSTFNGGGTSCRALLSTVGMRFDNIFIEGTYTNSGVNFSFDFNTSVVNNIVFNHATNTIWFSSFGDVNNIRNNGSFSLNMDISGDDCEFSNCNLNGGGTSATIAVNNSANYKLININAAAIQESAGAQRGKLSNCTFTTTGTYTPNSDNGLFENCHWGGGITIGSGIDRNKFSNCDILGAVSVTGDDNGFSNCQIGASAGGGTNTITINAGSDRTRVTGCMTDAAIVDNGTASALANNTIY